MRKMNMSTVVIGLGNPVLTDDSVGFHAAREISTRLRGREDVVVREICSGGLDLMEAMVGYERAIVMDAAVTGRVDPGAVFTLRLSDLLRSRNTASVHNASIEVAIELGMLAGLALPRDIRFWAVEAEDVTTFNEQLTETVQRALPVLITNVLRDIDDGMVTHPEKSL